MDYSHLLKQARDRACMSARDVARLIDADTPQVYAWEAGRIRPSIETLRKYVAAGLLDPAEIFGTEEGDAA